MNYSNLMLFDKSLPLQSIDAYIARAYQIPLLTENEEFELADHLQKNNDLEAAKRLILPHLRYVISVARGFLGYGIALADLIQEGNVGLMKAVKRFNPALKVRLVTFALYWIKAEIHDFIIRNWRIVKVATTKVQRKLFFKLRSAKKYLAWFTREEIQTVAKDLGVPPEAVREMEMRMHATDTAFDASLNDEEPTEQFAPADYLTDDSLSPTTLLDNDAVQMKARLYAAFSQLNERERDIIQSRFIDENKLTLQELAEKYKISIERVRQIEKAAFDKLKVSLQTIE